MIIIMMIIKYIAHLIIFNLLIDIMNGIILVPIMTKTKLTMTIYSTFYLLSE